MLVDAQGRTCARLGLNRSQSDEPELVLFEPRSGRRQLEISLDVLGGSHILMRDMCSAVGPGAELELVNQGDPGVPSMRLLGKPEKSGERSELRLEVSAFGPGLVGTNLAGRVTTILGPK